METNFIKEYPDTLTKQECVKVINRFEELRCIFPSFEADGSTDQGGGIIRSDTALYLSRTDADLHNFVTEKVGHCWGKYIEEFRFLQGKKVISYESKMQKTEPMGGFHMWHWEHGGKHEYRNRMAVWTLYLTDHEDEGETEFLAHGLKVKPEAGKFCIFPADYTAVHRGNPVYSKPKYIVTGWYEYND